MLETEDDGESNLKLAVDIGQRLLRRNQELAEEQLSYEAKLAERDARIAKLEEVVSGRAVAQNAGFVLLLEGRVAAVEQQRDNAERQVHTLRDMLGQAERRLASSEATRAAQELRDKDTIATLNARVDLMLLELQRKDADLAAALSDQAKLVSQLGSLKTRHNELVQECDALKAKALDRTAALARSSFHELDVTGASARPGPSAVLVEQLQRQVVTEQALCEELADELQEERAARAAADATVTDLQATVEEQRLQMEKQEIALSKLRSEQASMTPPLPARECAAEGSMAESPPPKKHDDSLLNEMGDDETFMSLLQRNKMAVTPRASPLRRASVTDENDMMAELVHYKVLYCSRQAADQEFQLRFRKLDQMLDATHYASVERECQSRGMKPSLAELRKLSDARVDTLIDQARLTIVMPTMAELPYARGVLEFFIRAVNNQRTINTAVVGSPKKK